MTFAGRVRITRLALLVAFSIVWELAARVSGPTALPTPAGTVVALVHLVQEGTLGVALSATLAVFLSGFVAAGVVGVATGLTLGLLPVLGRAAEPLVYALAATPRVAFVPMVIVLLGLGLEAKTFIVFLGAVMPVVINTLTGVRATDPDLTEMARATGASRGAILAWIVLPGALPIIITGLRLGATIGLINTIVAELYTAISGLGGLLARYGGSFRMAEYMAVVLCLAALGVLLTEGLRLVEARAYRAME